MPDTKQRPRARSRREALKILAVGGAAGLAGVAGLTARARRGQVVRSRVLMGTAVTLTVVGPDLAEAEAAASAALGRMGALEGLLSRYRADSEVTRLNTAGRVEGASDALLDVLDVADRVWRLGDGRFDVTVQPVLDLYRAEAGIRRDTLPDPAEIERALDLVDQRGLRTDGRLVTLPAGARITLDGVGKGYVVDRGVDALRERGFANVLVEAGGDLLAAGDRGKGAPWRIGIREPRRGLSLIARIDARDCAVATSGDSMQPFTSDYSQHHIIDPRTGYSAPELSSSTVVAPDAATADALATLTMVLGPRRGRALLEDCPGCEGYFVAKDRSVTRTTNFETAS